MPTILVILKNMDINPIFVGGFVIWKYIHTIRSFF